jgi:hypothetical protein
MVGSAWRRRAGTYRLQRVEGLRSPLDRMWLKSVIVNGRDILDAPIELRQAPSCS